MYEYYTVYLSDERPGELDRAIRRGEEVERRLKDAGWRVDELRDRVGCLLTCRGRRVRAVCDCRYYDTRYDGMWTVMVTARGADWPLPITTDELKALAARYCAEAQIEANTP